MSIKFQPIYLSEDYYYNQGRHRLVYSHPEDPDLLIKIFKSTLSKWISNIPISYKNRYRFYKNFLREINEHARIRLQCSENSSSHIIQNIVGFVDTNLGLGLVVKAELDQHGKYAKSLSYLIKNGLFNELVLQHLEEFLLSLLEIDICIYELHPGNIVYSYSADKGNYFVLIDGLGGGPLISLGLYFSFVRRYKRKNFINKLRNKILTLTNEYR